MSAQPRSRREPLHLLLLAALALACLLFPLGRVHGGVAEDERKEIDRLVRLYLAGQVEPLQASFARPLAARFKVEDLRRQRDELVARGGLIRAIRPAVEQPAQEGRPASLRVPIEFERAGAILVLAWQPPLRANGISVFRVEPVGRSGNQPAPAGDQYRDARYVDRKRFQEETISFGELPGRAAMLLARPETTYQPVPCLLLVPSYTMADADGSVGRNKPMRDLAHGLASKGIAVARLPAKPPFEEPGIESWMLRDVVAALGVLARDRAIDPRHLYVGGWQSGGHIALQAAHRSPVRIRGAVLLSPAPAEGIEHEWRRLQRLSAAGMIPASAMATHEGNLRLYREGLLLDSDRLFDMRIGFWRSLEAAPVARALRAAPFDSLVIMPGKDWVLTDADRSGFERLAREEPRVWYRLESGANRWMQTTVGGEPSAELTEYGHVAAGVVDRIAGFVKSGDLRDRAGKENSGARR